MMVKFCKYPKFCAKVYRKKFLTFLLDAILFMANILRFVSI